GEGGDDDEGPAGHRPGRSGRRAAGRGLSWRRQVPFQAVGRLARRRGGNGLGFGRGAFAGGGRHSSRVFPLCVARKPPLGRFRAYRLVAPGTAPGSSEEDLMGFLTGKVARVAVGATFVGAAGLTTAVSLASNAPNGHYGESVEGGGYGHQGYGEEGEGYGH